MSAKLPQRFDVTVDVQLLRYNLPTAVLLIHTELDSRHAARYSFPKLCVRCGAKLRMATAFVRRMREANAKRLDLSRHPGPAVHRTVNCHADAIGVPPEFIFYPLPTAVASCMGVNGSVRPWIIESMDWKRAYVIPNP